MTKQEKIKMLKDDWPKPSKIKREDLIKALKKASKARLFDPENLDHSATHR